ncbi:MAG: tRNA methyl transferase PRC-barrel domain-containing protein, partial [Solirubrobacterales bacterium]
AKAGPGAIIDADGRQVGRHAGHERYTVGQRRGLGVAATEPLYVTAKDADTNTLTIGPAAALDRDHIELADVRVWRDISRIDGVRVRSHGAVVGCTAGRPSDRGRSLSLTLDDPVRALAPGQTASLLAGELVVGCGVIRLAPRPAGRLASAV